MQEADADWDADPNTSEAVFVFDNGFGIAVASGDRVRVSGTVSEFASSGSSLTELSSVNSVQAATPLQGRP